MCGIYGIFDPSLRLANRDLVDRMGRAMRHRGPDDSGSHLDGPLAFGMQRLAIIDVEGGHQPIANEDDSVIAVCNGEIYNFRELREELLAKGHQFRSSSDSEVIVHLYEEHGTDFVSRLSGMFGLALWDRKEARLILARDRLGIKPLYVSRQGAATVFASELKSILELPDVDRSLDTVAIDEYLALGYVPAPHSMFAGIRKLEPGAILSIDSSGQRETRYWDPPTDPLTERAGNDWPAEIRSAVEQSVVSQMVSDVPLGAFLSGGIDSSAVVAFMAKNSSRPVRTYSIGFDTGSGGSFYNELPYARQVSEMFGTDHHEIVVRPDVTELLPELLWHMDEPIADSAFITTYLVSKFARQDVTVILSGVGGDELFGGYRRYWGEYLAGLYRKIPSPIRRALIQPIGRRLPSDRGSRHLDAMRLLKGFLAGAELPDDARYEQYVGVFNRAGIARILGRETSDGSKAMRAAFERAAATDGLQRLFDVDRMMQLPDDLLMLTDRMSMATSLECRVPLLDDRLLDLSMRLPSSQKVRRTQLKYALKQSLRGVLPDEIIDRKKRGFGAPMGGWLKTELAGFLSTVLNEESVRRREIFEWEEIERLRQAHERNAEDNTDHLLALMNFEIWCQIYLDRASSSDVADRIAERQAV